MPMTDCYLQLYIYLLFKIHLFVVKLSVHTRVLFELLTHANSSVHSFCSEITFLWSHHDRHIVARRRKGIIP